MTGHTTKPFRKVVANGEYLVAHRHAVHAMTALFDVFCHLSHALSSEHADRAESLRNSVDAHDHHKADHVLEQADGGGVGELRLRQPMV